jgi:hypothetical protein
MWKWLAVASVLWGLFSLLTVLAPRSLALTAALDFQALGEAWQAEGPPPSLHDFEAHQLPPFTIPESRTELAVEGDGNRYLCWNPPAGGPAAMLGLPIAPAADLSDALTLRIRSKGLQQLFVGVRERDGSIYTAPVEAKGDWREHKLPLRQLRLSPRTPDENDQLDPDQISGIIVAALQPAGPERPGRGPRKQQPPPGPPPVVELDDIGIAAAP